MNTFRTALATALAAVTVCATLPAGAEEIHVAKAEHAPVIRYPGAYDEVDRTQPEEEPEESPVFGLLINPTTPVIGGFFGMMIIMPEAQIGLNDYVALDVQPAFVYHFGAQQQGITAYGGGGHLGARIAPGGTGLIGFYGVPRVGIVHARAEGGDDIVESTVVAPTLELGYAWASGNFLMNLGGGAGYGFSVDGYDVYASNPLDGLQLIANFSFGFGIY